MRCRIDPLGAENRRWKEAKMSIHGIQQVVHCRLLHGEGRFLHTYLLSWVIGPIMY